MVRFIPCIYHIAVLRFMARWIIIVNRQFLVTRQPGLLKNCKILRCLFAYIGDSFRKHGSVRAAEQILEKGKMLSETNLSVCKKKKRRNTLSATWLVAFARLKRGLL